MATGTVKWFNGTKGYGFIAPDEGDADIFVHISQVQQSGLNELQDNQKVSFDVEEGRNGKNQATNLHPELMRSNKLVRSDASLVTLGRFMFF